MLPGIGAKGADKLWLAYSSKLAVQTTAPETSPASTAPLATTLQACLPAVPKKSATAWAQLTATISQLETKPAAGNPSK